MERHKVQFRIIDEARSRSRNADKPVNGRRPQAGLVQKKDKPGKRETAAKQDRPVAHIKSNESTVRHDGDEL
jgi:hypothetical protein